jgi:hypothetical protein
MPVAAAHAVQELARRWQNRKQFFNYKVKQKNPFGDFFVLWTLVGAPGLEPGTGRVYGLRP